MPTIELQHPVNLPANLVGPALRGVLEKIERADPADPPFALSVGLEDLHLPDAATVSVPIDLHVGVAHGKHSTSVDFDFSARSHRKLFPAFKGTLRTDPLGPSNSALWFSGSYAPPLGALGRALDATIMRGVAQRTLAAFLARIAGDAVAAINAHERAAIRSAESR